MKNNRSSLELEERLMRLNVVIKCLNEQLKETGSRIWEIEDDLKGEYDGYEVIIVDGEEYYDENYSGIKKHAMDVLVSMANSGLRGSSEPGIRQKWDDLTAIWKEADRLLKFHNIENRKQKIEEERENIINLLAHRTIVKEEKNVGEFENKRVKILVNEYKKNHKNCTVEEAIFAVSMDEGKEFEAVKRGYYYKGKK
jgi:hypothetical protein